jgi:hypothetical protein
MKWLKWEFKLGIVLILLSVSVYTLKFLVFGELDSTIIYLFNVSGFLPVNILLVTLILNQLLIMRSKKEKLEKMKIVIGTFFSEFGTKLLVFFSNSDTNLEEIRDHLIVSNDWSDNEFVRVNRNLQQHTYEVDVNKIDFISLKQFLVQHRTFLIRLLENPILFEHAPFTELLRAIFHLTEELESRDRLIDLPERDYAHLKGDIQRAYILLMSQWLDYMKYLMNKYPYLFSLAIRKNPFDVKASPILH